MVSLRSKPLAYDKQRRVVSVEDFIKLPEGHCFVEKQF